MSTTAAARRTPASRVTFAGLSRNRASPQRPNNAKRDDRDARGEGEEQAAAAGTEVPALVEEEEEERLVRDQQDAEDSERDEQSADRRHEHQSAHGLEEAEGHVRFDDRPIVHAVPVVLTDRVADPLGVPAAETGITQPQRSEAT